MLFIKEYVFQAPDILTVFNVSVMRKAHERGPPPFAKSA